VPVPAVVAVMEGGVTPRYPSVVGRMKAKKAPVETVAPAREPRGCVIARVARYIAPPDADRTTREPGRLS
jgi:electron transfer flavoprotein beta subunit